MTAGTAFNRVWKDGQAQLPDDVSDNWRLLNTGISTRREHCRGLALFLIGWLTLAFTAHAQNAGIIIYTTPPSTYVELTRFVSLERNNAAYSTARKTDGQSVQIDNSGIISTLYNPPASPDPDAEASAADTIRQIASLIVKYPDYSSQLRPLSDQWRRFDQASSRALRASPAVAPPSGGGVLNFTTKDGRRYENVTVTSVDATSLHFSYSDGVAAVDFEQLPPTIQQQFHYHKTASSVSANPGTGIHQPSVAPASVPVYPTQVAPSPVSLAANAPSPMALGAASPNSPTATPSGTPEKLSDFKRMLRKYHADGTDAIQEKLVKDNYYFVGGGAFQGFFIAQVGDDFIFAANTRHDPWAILMFDDPSALGNIQIPKDGMAQAVGRFQGYKTITLTDGSENRFPVFSCVGLEVLGGDFVNTEKKGN